MERNSHRICRFIFMAIMLMAVMSFASGTKKEPANKRKLFNYRLYAKVLKTYVDDKGMVNYKALLKNRKDLDRFTVLLGWARPAAYAKWQESDKVAFLVNAYNAFTLKLILNHYPIKKSGWFSRFPDSSIRQIDGAWDKIEFNLMGKKVTLGHIEHEMLRKGFDRPGIHLALVCAAMSCPSLRNEPYIGKKLKEQLKDQTKKFLRDPGKFRIDRQDNKVYLSPIFKWFGKDFVKTYGTETRFKKQSKVDRAVLNYISGHLKKQDREYLEQKEFKIKYLDYDWSLNEQKKD